MEMLLEILKWVKGRSAPNESYKYSRCVICGHAWWDDKEEHNFDCWVPRLKEAVEHSLHPTGLESVDLEVLHAEVCRRRYVAVEPASG